MVRVYLPLRPQITKTIAATINIPTTTYSVSPVMRQPSRNLFSK
jgi:hypothetical protein